jgi:Copine/C2 domain
MKLRLSCCGEGLRASDNPKGIHVIATQIHPEVGVKPTVLGQTESIVSTTNVVDWTRSFVLDYEFGQELNIIISLRSGSRAISSALFDVSQVLGNGGILGKELKDKNGILIVRIEECKCVGQLQLQIRGLQLKNLDGIGFGMNKSDPFFEIQRQRVLARNNTVVWDAVYRSMVIDNDLNPIFSEFFIDLDELVGSSSESDLAAKKFRVIMFDYDKKGNQEIGSCLLSVNDLIDSVNDTALSSNASLIDSNKYFSLTLGPSQEVTGKIVVVKAKLIGVDVTEESTVNTFEKAPIVDSSIQDVVNVPTVYATDELTFEPSDAMSSTFCYYIKGGCQLRVMCAIDATADNGDPRQESSLHYFNDNGLNLYEESIKAIFSVFWLYDSDQKYPVYGFGAKRDGVVSQCFPFGSSLEVDGVDGILKVYRETFRSGISMSSPRDFSEVIQTAGKSAQQELVRFKGALIWQFRHDEYGSHSRFVFVRFKHSNPVSLIQFF